MSSKIPESKRAYCDVCDKAIWRSATSAAVQVCLDCRRAGRGPYSHGASGYRRGCRCDVCRAGASQRMREYSARRRAEGVPIDFREYRQRVSATCEQCSEIFMVGKDRRGRFCSLNCANDYQGRSLTPRSNFKVASSVRLSIYEAAGWKCTLCECPTRPGEDYNHPRYPTLDHVIPRSKGGSDDPSNLRLACRQCNITRGNDVDWAPELVEVA